MKPYEGKKAGEVIEVSPMWVEMLTRNGYIQDVYEKKIPVRKVSTK